MGYIDDVAVIGGGLGVGTVSVSKKGCLRLMSASIGLRCGISTLRTKRPRKGL